MSEIKLVNPVEGPTEVLSRHNILTGLVTLEEAKHAYWNRCIAGTDPVTRKPYKRFVANKKTLGDYGKTSNVMDIWEPKSVDDDYNLVLSLCTDGQHRTLIDVDDVEYGKPPLKLPGSELFATSVVPSTSHWHVYMHHGVSMRIQLKYLEDNPKYLENVKKTGFASLRPPWISKGWMEPVFYKSEFHGFLDEDWLPPVPKDDGKIGWEDLFNEG